MFVYEQGNSLNITLKGSIPVENPDISIKGYKDGAILTVNGVNYGTASEEFEGRAKTFVYQKDGKLMITFKGIEGMSSPDVILDETSDGVVNAVVGSTSLVINYSNDVFSVEGTTTEDDNSEEEKESEVIIPDITGDAVEEEDIIDPEEELEPETEE